MKITIVSIGKAHDKKISEAINDYQKRLETHCKIRWDIIPAADPDNENQKILSRLKGFVILLDETGVLLTTEGLAKKIEHLQNNSTKELTVIIGGAFGVDKEVKQRADFIWSLSPLVFPHQLVRLILIEQLYRAHDLLAGGKYHHG